MTKGVVESVGLFSVGTESVGSSVAMSGASKRRSRVRSKIPLPRRFVCRWEGCTYSSKQLSNLLTHGRVHTGERPYVCEWPGCSYRARQSDHLKSHVRTHTGERPYTCGWRGCTYSSTQSSAVRSHMRSHTGDKPFKCVHEDCDYASTQSGNLRRHRQLRHAPSENRFRCDGVGCVFSTTSRYALSIHKRSHSGDRPFKCAWPGGCEYAANTAGALKVHMRVHTGEAPFRCRWPGCSYVAKQRPHLTSHMDRRHKVAEAATPSSNQSN